MDFGSAGLDGLIDSNPDSAPDAPPDPPEPESKSVGSGTSKQGRPTRPTPVLGVEEWRSSKLIKNADDFSVPKTMPKDGTRSNAAGESFFSDGHHPQHMLSFSSSPKSETRANSLSSSALPYLSYSPSLYNTLAGFGNGNQHGGSMQMQGVFKGTRGPFTPSQWIELEHQALIYKYITANIPIPSKLLVPIKKAFESTGLSCYPGGYLRSNSLGWGSFYLGFSNTGDPEPGRCRRTDGKKWRCSRDAVVGQKYCEKHMNRGRHRSRKPVEGQNGHPVAGTASASVSLKKMSAVSSSSVVGQMATAVTGSGASNSLAAMAHHQQQVKSLHSSVIPADPTLKRFFGDQENVNEEKQNPLLTMKQQLTFDDASRLQFGVDNLLDCRGFASAQDLGCIPETDTARGLVHQFIDDWPENSVGRLAMSWADTHLSVSIPMASSDSISATSSLSPTIERTNLLPFRWSRKSDPLYMNRGVVGTVSGDRTHKQNSLCESSMGGPLGEVLHNTGNAINWGEAGNSPLLNLMKDGWDKSPSMGSSPTGVLQRTTFRSLSNSSTGSSPRAEYKPMDGIHIASCNELLGSNLANSS